MSAHRYRAAAIRGDYVRAGAGLAMVCAPLAAAPLGPVAAGSLGALALLFAAFGGRTWLRHRSLYRVDERGIAREGPFGAMLAWETLAGVRLRYFATRRDRRNGWMQLTLKGADATMRIDSTLEEFRDVALAALKAAEEAGVPLDATTRENARALGRGEGA